MPFALSSYIPPSLPLPPPIGCVNFLVKSVLEVLPPSVVGGCGLKYSHEGGRVVVVVVVVVMAASAVYLSGCLGCAGTVTCFVSRVVVVVSR